MRREFSECLPVVMFPGSFWKRAVNWDVFVDTGVVSERDLGLLFFTDDVGEAFEHVTARLLQWEERAAAKAGAAGLPRSDAARAYDALVGAAGQKAGGVGEGAGAV